MPKLPDSNVYCSEVRHVTQLKVDDKGLEGAAVTVVAADRATSAPMNDYEDVYIDLSQTVLSGSSFPTRTASPSFRASCAYMIRRVRHSIQ